MIKDERLTPEEIVDADEAFKLVRKLVGWGNKVSVEHTTSSEKPAGYYRVAQLAKADKATVPDREKIVGILEAWQEEGKDYVVQFSYSGIAHEISSLLPDPEAIRREERERIVEWGEEICPDHWARRPDGTMKSRTPRRILCRSCWQALRGEGK